MAFCPGIPLNWRSIMLLLVLVWVLPPARAGCDACIEGRCLKKTTLVRELYIPDQMAIDRKNNILYIHTDSDTNTAFFYKDLRIQLVRRLNFSGLTVDQDTQMLYTADNKNVHEYSPNNMNKSRKLSFSNQNKYFAPNSLFLKDCLTYTEKSRSGLFYIINNELWLYISLAKYKISDFVVQAGCESPKIYFVANDATYFYNGTGNDDVISVLATKSLVLSIDNYNDVYFGDAKLNVIYKMDNETNKLVEYAAYESGSVDKFVFDKNNDIVSYDSSDGSFSLWEWDWWVAVVFHNCSIEASKYLIKKICLIGNC